VSRPSKILDPLLQKLELMGTLDVEDRKAVLALPARVVRFRALEYVVREKDRAQNCCVLLDGFAVRHKMTGDGGRQIFSINMRGDLADLQNSFLHIADHHLQALTDLEVALIPVSAMVDLAFSRPAIGRAMWSETLIEASIFREWTLNVGRRDGRTRMAHMLCEFALRLELAGLSARDHYVLPMSQEQLADALGLTSVHVNRTLKSLAEDGLVTRTRRSIKIEDWAGLAAQGDFDSAYLHLGLAEA